MQNANIRHSFHLHGKKIITFALLCFIFCFNEVHAQNNDKINLPNYDKKWLHYGFVIGTHFSSMGLQYNENFTDRRMDTLHSIMPKNTFGFSLGLIVNLRLNQFFDLRLLPEVSFYEHHITYNYINESQHNELIESTFVEFPLLVKYKSERRKNTRMYLVGGIEPGIEATGSKDPQLMEDKLIIEDANMSISVGVGLDIYYPLFKFSPEIRYSHGITNLLSPVNDNHLSEGINRLTTNTVTLYFLFE